MNPQGYTTEILFSPRLKLRKDWVEHYRDRMVAEAWMEFQAFEYATDPWAASESIGVWIVRVGGFWWVFVSKRGNPILGELHRHTAIGKYKRKWQAKLHRWGLVKWFNLRRRLQTWIGPQ